MYTWLSHTPLTRPFTLYLPSGIPHLFLSFSVSSPYHHIQLLHHPFSSPSLFISHPLPSPPFPNLSLYEHTMYVYIYALNLTSLSGNRTRFTK